MPVRRIKLVGEVGPRSRTTLGLSGPMLLLNSLSPLLERCVRTAPFDAAEGAVCGCAAEPRKNLSRSGATFPTLQEKRALYPLGSNFVSTRVRCVPIPPPLDDFDTQQPAAAAAAISRFGSGLDSLRMSIAPLKKTPS